MNSFLVRNQIPIARISILVLFLALIRTISEPLRLHHAAGDIQWEIIEPYLWAALIEVIGLLIMSLCTFYHKYKWVPWICVLVIAIMVWIKVKYIL